MFLKKHLEIFLNKGTNFVKNHEDKRRVREINSLIFFGVLLIIPLIIIRNILIEDWKEVQLFCGYIVILIVALYLNQNGKNQLSAKISLLTSIGLTAIAVVINTVQIGAPYLNIIIAISSLHLIKSTKYAILILAISFLIFIITIWYQSAYYPFDFDEFKLTILVTLLLFTMMFFSRKEVNRMQKEIYAQATTIQVQNEEMLALKQKDLENASGSFSILSKYKHDLIRDLEAALNSGNIQDNVARVLLQLRSEHEIHTRLGMFTENFEQINADFYARLLKAHPKLTTNDKELAAYLRLGVSTKEIATLKNTTENAITVAKSRLRKKMTFEQNTEMVNYLSQL